MKLSLYVSNETSGPEVFFEWILGVDDQTGPKVPIRYVGSLIVPKQVHQIIHGLLGKNVEFAGILEAALERERGLA